MNLRVEIGNKKEIYSFPDKNSIKIGRSNSCDLQLLSEGVSRFHVEIREVNGSFEVVDLGSTNGSFMNEERLDVDASYPFNTFFPVKLGHSVLIYLVGMQESQEVGNVFTQNSDESTDVIDTNKTVTSFKVDQTNEIKISNKTSITKNYKSSRKKKVTSRPNNANQFKFTATIVLVAFLAFIAYEKQDKWLSFISPEKPVVRKPIKKVKRKIASVKKKPKVNKSEVILKAAKDSLNKDKCLDSNVGEICNLLKKTKSRNYFEGAFVKGDVLYIVVDAKASYTHYAKSVSKYHPNKEEKVLNILMRNSKYMQKIIEFKRERKKIDIYSLASNPNEVDYLQFSDVVILSELLFSPLRESLLKSKFSKINISTYKVDGGQYEFLDHWYFNRDYLHFKGEKLKDIEFYLKVALFHGDLSLFNLYRRILKPIIVNK